MQYRIQLDYDLKDLRQFDQLHQKFRSRMLYRVIHILLVLLVLLPLVFLSLHAATREIIVSYAFNLLLFALYFALREIRARALLKSLTAQGTVVVLADDECIRAEAKGLSKVFRYESICDSVHFKDTYYLYLDERKAQILPERCFVEGDPATFGGFIAGKTGLEVNEVK